MGRSLLFVSSVQKEFAEGRAAIRDFVRGDALLRRYFDVFVFEDLPASDRRADAVYLNQVDDCGVYVGLFGNEYGDEDEGGKSPTEREFDLATEKGKTRLIFVKGQDDKSKHPKMQKLIRRAGAQLIRQRFAETPDLTAALYASLVEHLERIGKLRTLPFDASACPRASMNDVLQKNITWFLETAKRERSYALSAKTSRKKALAHLNLLEMVSLPMRPSCCSATIPSACSRRRKSSVFTSTALRSGSPYLPTRFSRVPSLTWWTRPWTL